MMARSHSFTRSCARFVFLPLVPLLLFAGCRSTSSSRNNSAGGCCGGGGGGGCCRGETPNNPPTAAHPVSSPVVDFTSAPSASRSDSTATNSSSSSVPSTPGGLYGGQIACPVTGEPLGTMGTPIPVTVKGQTIYVCCKGCVAKVQANPDFYLQKVQAERGGQSQGTPPPSNSSSQSSRSSSSGGSCCHSGGGGCCGR
jgi:hypothetical protein